jgi:hypothetical protein
VTTPHFMKTLILRITSICLLSAAALTGYATRGSEFLGKWVNTKNPTHRIGPGKILARLQLCPAESSP